jgi:hypothetical protein
MAVRSHTSFLLEARGPHVFPPRDVVRLPLLEGALEFLVAAEGDVVGDLGFEVDVAHKCSRFQVRFIVVAPTSAGFRGCSTERSR